MQGKHSSRCWGYQISVARNGRRRRGREESEEGTTLKRSNIASISEASFSAAPISSCIPPFHDNSAMSFPLFRVVYPPDFDVDADDHFRLYLETQFRGELRRNPGARRADQKPCLNHGLRTVCPSPVAPKTNIFSAPAVSPHRNSQRCPKLYR